MARSANSGVNGVQATHEPTLQQLVSRVMESGKFDQIQVWFESVVLDRYRGDLDCRILRSDSAGRLRGPGGWIINFGISPDDSVIHMPIGTALGIGESHRAHWMAHLVGLPVGANFLKMTMTPGACIGDGETRAW